MGEKAPRSASRRLLSGAILLTFVLVLVALVVVLQQPTSPSWDDIVQSKGFLPGESHSAVAPARQRQTFNATKGQQFVINVDPYLTPRNYSIGEGNSGDDVILPVGKRPLCSPAVFRQHYRAKGYFPGAGVWTPAGQYIPDICKFGFRSPLTNSLAQCFGRRKIRSIAVFGASQGQKYATELTNFITMAFPHCKRVKAEKQIDRLPQASYYTGKGGDPTGKLHATRRYCSGCASYKTRCATKSKSSSVSLEYFGMDDLLDSTLRLYAKARERAIETYQEFIFRKYLSPTPPDLIIISPAANHIKFKDSPAKVALDVNYLQSLIRIYLPKTTRTLWLTGMSEYEGALKRNPNYKLKRVDRHLATDAIDRLNHIIFEVNKDNMLDAQSGILGFLDLVPPSESVPKNWWGDFGVHMHVQWYKNIALYLLAYLCA